MGVPTEGALEGAEKGMLLVVQEAHISHPSAEAGGVLMIFRNIGNDMSLGVHARTAASRGGVGCQA